MRTQRHRYQRFIGSIGAALLILGSAPIGAESEQPDGPTYTSDNLLIKPEHYREWPCIGTGVGMAYGPLRDTASAHPPFTNVYVNPSSYRAFLKSGTWPDQTIFVLEVRSSVAVNKAEGGKNGHFQGEIVGIEAEVKDTKRFAGSWAFFGLNKAKASGAQIPTTASCYSCHATNAAVDNTFVQFYPVLRDVAKDKGTMKPVPETF